MERERQKYAQSRGGRYAGPRFDSQQQCAAMERRHTRARRLRMHCAGILYKGTNFPSTTTAFLLRMSHQPPPLQQQD